MQIDGDNFLLPSNTIDGGFRVGYGDIIRQCN